MCGIIGIIGENINAYNKKTLHAMLDTLFKRGPDDSGILSFPNCLLGQTRLSILDLTSGHQPMFDKKFDMAIIFNGEIYNYRELKKDLEKRGYVFSTKSDTEVILKTYIEYGNNCPKYLDGMFAFVIWDNKKNQLFMARDRFGKKPLYYTFDDKKNLLIASEIKALFQSKQIKGEINYEAIDNYLTLMYIPPWKTVYKNIYVIPPASFAIFENKNLHIKKYWQLEKKNILTTYEEAKEKVRDLLTKSVEKRMIADVEIGSFLSGGIDSTLVTTIAQSFSQTPIKTFSVGYQDYIDELPFALEAAKKNKTDHHTLQAKDDMAQELKTAIEYFDEPHADSSDFPQYLLSKFAATKEKVALSGDGADELFGGYRKHLAEMKIRAMGGFKKSIIRGSSKVLKFNKSSRSEGLGDFNRRLQKLSDGMDLSPTERYTNWCKWITDADRVKLIKEKNNELVLKTGEGIISDLNDFLIRDQNFVLPNDMLKKIDLMSMAHALEVRVPFLDHQLVEFANSLPTDYKITKHETNNM